MQQMYVLVVLLLAAGCSAQPRSNLLNLVRLEAHPLAQCNDGTAAAYYRRPLNSFEVTKKLLIYLQGGGMCAPYTPGNKVDTTNRCEALKYFIFFKYVKY